MKVARFVCSVAAAMILAGAAPPALAQVPPDQNADESRERPWMHRERGRLDLDRLIKTVEEKLDLSADQRDGIRELAEEHRERLEEERTKRRESLEEQKDTIRQLFQEQMEAREAGDRERQKEISEQIRQLQPKDTRSELEEEFIKGVEQVLDEEQRADFRKIVQQMRNPAMDPERLRQNPSLLRRAVSRLHLSEDQRADIDELFKEYWQQMRDGDPSNRDAREQLAADFHKQVMEILTEEQAEQLKDNLTDRTPRPRPSLHGGPPEPPGEEADQASEEAEPEPDVEED